MNIKIQDLISLLALILSIIGIFYTRKNIKLTKFIDTITNQRIKWIDKLREDMAKITSLARLTYEYSNALENAEEFFASPVACQMENDEYNDLCDEIREFRKKKEVVLQEIKNVETLNLIELVLLRLNEEDDIELINKLQNLRENIIKDDYKKITPDFIILMNNETKKLLKNEWEKIKKEVIYGREINTRTEKTIFFWK